MPVALIDGDIAAYRAACALQRDYQWEPGHKASVANNQEAADAALWTIAAWTKLSGCNDQLVAFTGRHNFRKLVLPSYKANRAGVSKPLAYEYTVNACRERFRSELIDGLEADDILGILATSPKYDGAVVCTLDKDLRTVPGRHLNPLKDTRPVTVNAVQGAYRWLLQTLRGDAVDGYTGIPGVGPKKALLALGAEAPVSVLWPRVVAAYHDSGLTEVDALTQARVARILQRCDYDRETKEILLWHPTTPLRLSLAALSPTSPASMETALA
jgi:DNA polymerase-1